MCTVYLQTRLMYTILAGILHLHSQPDRIPCIFILIKTITAQIRGIGACRELAWLVGLGVCSVKVLGSSPGFANARFLWPGPCIQGLLNRGRSKGTYLEEISPSLKNIRRRRRREENVARVPKHWPITSWNQNNIFHN